MFMTNIAPKKIIDNCICKETCFSNTHKINKEINKLKKTIIKFILLIN